MDKRTFIKTILNASLAIAAGASFSACNAQKKSAGQLRPFSTPRPLPDRWVWFRPNLEWTTDDWKNTFERFNKAGIQGILPQVYASRATLFDHPVLPVKKRWLEDIIPLAHSFGLEVHAWMWTMILNEKSMVEKHPDWYSFNRNGQPAHTHPAYVDYYKFMCPCNPEVQEFVAGNVEALGKIEGLDGIHLDYVRQPDVILAEGLQPKYHIVQDKEYPEYDYPYSENCRKLFKEEHGIDPMDLGDEAPAHEAWRQFRYDAVSNVVNNHCVPMARKYNKPITAAVFPNWESVRQQWHHWDLDGFLPMLYHGFYNEDINWIGEEVKKAKTRLEKAHNPKNVYSGLFIPHLSPQEIAPALKTAKENGASGFALFDLGAISEEHWDALEVY
jgi:uncharacterized lipoprotein YddW (UPF0748 family)